MLQKDHKGDQVDLVCDHKIGEDKVCLIDKLFARRFQQVA